MIAIKQYYKRGKLVHLVNCQTRTSESKVQSDRVPGKHSVNQYVSASNTTKGDEAVKNGQKEHLYSNSEKEQKVK